MTAEPTRTGRGYVIQGVPLRTGVFRFTLTATDATGAHVTRRFKIRVR